MTRTALLITALLGSCKPAGTPCTSTVQCGELQACLEEVCTDVMCLASSDCAIESFCHPETFTCEPGCATSDDCLVGDRCDVETATCVPRACRDTQLDCDRLERCDAASGECVRDREGHCDPCTGDFQCGDGGACMRLTFDDRARCYRRCSPEAVDPCPAGLQCSAQITIDGQPDGFRCVGLCQGL